MAIDLLDYRFSQILEMDEDDHWYKADLDGRVGFVPSNYIRLARVGVE